MPHPIVVRINVGYVCVYRLPLQYNIAGTGVLILELEGRAEICSEIPNKCDKRGSAGRPMA